MRYFLVVFVLGVVAVVSVAGWRGGRSSRPPLEVFPDMDRQNRLRPQGVSSFLPGGRSSQVYVGGTVARGMGYRDLPVNTGRVRGSTNFVRAVPVEVTGGLLERGRERYGIFCLPCHGAAGDGRGVVTRFGMVAVASFHDARLVKMGAGEIFNTVSYGKGLMGGYGASLEVGDRWAVVAYVRALQRSRLAVLDEVPEGVRGGLLSGGEGVVAE